MKAKQNHPNEEATLLLREAAAVGPGFRGQRRPSTLSKRAELKEKLSSQNIDTPAFLDQDNTWIDRRAKLFEAGDYPDKGVTVTTDTLLKLEQSFDLPVPVLIEHSKSPIEVGYLTNVEAQGEQLFGTVALTKEANDLIEKLGAHALSLGLSADLCEIVEVSLVKKPRVASARLFTGEVFQEDWKVKFEELATEVECGKARAKVERLVAEGRLTPAQAPFANAILQTKEAVLFDGESTPVQRLFDAFLETAPSFNLLEELAPHATKPQTNLDQESQAFYQRYFPGLSLEEIARHSDRAL